MSDIRKQFPFFQKTEQVWLDSASTTQKPSVLIDTEQTIYKESNANIHRGLYASSESITQKYEEAHSSVAQWINSLKEEVIFTSGTTAAINCIATYWAPLFLKKGDEII
ncbi:aminotransferase class V-fold PLP-dependent enzyme, partial [Candidatus Babeliales bacterium]|nr:aminotransferase class V-fold PLP-dependent enzyme [Candidatus Babeliales bacterium]